MKKITSAQLVDSIDTYLTIDSSSNDASIGDSFPNSLGIYSKSVGGSASMKSLESYDVGKDQFEDEMIFYLYIDGAVANSPNSISIQFLKDQNFILDSFSLSGNSFNNLDFEIYEMKLVYEYENSQLWTTKIIKKSRDFQFQYRYQFGLLTEHKFRMGDLEQSDIFDIFIPASNVTNSRGSIALIKNDVFLIFLKNILSSWCSSNSEEYEDSLYYFLRCLQSLLQTCQQWSKSREGIEYSFDRISKSLLLIFRFVIENLDDKPKNSFAALSILGYLESFDGITKEDIVKLLLLLKSKKSLEFQLKEEVSSSIRHIEWICNGARKLCQHPNLTNSEKYLWLGSTYILKLLEAEDVFLINFKSNIDRKELTHSYYITIDELCKDGALCGQQKKGVSRIRHIFEALIRNAPSYEGLAYFIVKNQNVRILNSQNCLSALKEKLENLDNFPFLVESIEFEKLFKMIENLKTISIFEDIVCILLKSNIFKKVDSSYSIRLLSYVEEFPTGSKISTLHNINSIREWTNYLLNHSNATFQECLNTLNHILQIPFLSDHQQTFIDEIASSRHIVGLQTDSDRIYNLVRYYNSQYCNILKSDLFQKRCLYIIKHTENDNNQLSMLYDAVCSGCGERQFSEWLLWKIYCTSHCSLLDSSIISNPIWESILSSERRFTSNKLQDVYHKGIQSVRKICDLISSNKVSLQTFKLLIDYKERFEKFVDNVGKEALNEFQFHFNRLKEKFNQLQQRMSHYHVVMTNYCSNFSLRFTGDLGVNMILDRQFDSPETLAIDDAEYVVFEFSKIISNIDAKWMYQLRSSEIFLHIWKCEAEKFTKSDNGDSLNNVLNLSKKRWLHTFQLIDSLQILNYELEPLLEKITTEKYFNELEKLYLFQRPDFEIKDGLNDFEIKKWIVERENLLLHLQKRKYYSGLVIHILELLDHLSHKMPHLTHDPIYQLLETIKKEIDSTNDIYSLKEAKKFESYPFYLLSTLQMQFISIIFSQKSLIKWLSNHYSDSDFGNLITICKQFDDDAKVRESLESLSLIRSLLHEILYSESISNIHILEHKVLSIPIQLKHIQEAKSLVKDFPLLLTVFREKTLSQGIQSIHMLRALMKFGQYKIGNQITCFLTSSTDDHVWDMDSLLDLRSKLMLAEIPQKIQESEVNVNIFVRQIPLLLDLRSLHRYLYNQGHFQFSDANFCQIIPVNTSIQIFHQHIQKLQELKITWKNIVRKARQMIYSLNFFTMRQLSTIANLFFESKNSEKLFSQLFGLLHNMENYISSNIVKQIINDEWYTITQWKGFSSEEKLLNLGKFLDKIFKQGKLHQSKGFKDHRSWSSDNSKDMKLLIKDLQEEPFNNIQFWEKIKAYNFCIVSRDTYKEVLDSIVTIYATEKRIPKPDEVYICDNNSEIEDIILIINRWYYSYLYGDSTSIYCIANIHFLSYSTQARIFVHLNHLLRSCKEENRPKMARLVLLNASKHDTGLESQHLLTTLSQYIVTFSELTHHNIVKIYQWIVSSQIKISNSLRVMSFWSMFPGGGKTHSILKIIQQKGGVYKRISTDNTEIDKFVELLINNEDKVECRNFHILVGEESQVKDDILLFHLFYIGALRSTNMVYSFHLNSQDYFYLELGGRSISNQTDSPYTTMAVIPRLPQILIPKPNSSKFHLDFERYEYFYEDEKLLFKFFPENQLKEVCQFLMNFRSNEYGINFSISRVQCIDVLSSFLKDYTFTREEFNSMNKVYSFIKILHYFIHSPLIHSMSNDQIEWMIHCSADFSCQYVFNPEYGNNDYKKRIQNILQWQDILPQKRFIIFDNLIKNVDFISYTSDALIMKNGKQIQSSNHSKFHIYPCKDLTHKSLQPLLCKIFSIQTQPVTFTTFALSDGHAAMILHLTYRLKFNLPCILVAETGSGKSESIRYIASVLGVEMHRFSLHGGHNPHNIIEWLSPLIKKANSSPSTPIFVFIDQLNSATCMSFLKDIICDRMINNRPLPQNIKLIAAANPHRISKQSYNSDSNQNLVYQVKQMPESLLQYVLDFGKLTEGKEELYVQSIIQNELKIFSHSPEANTFIINFANLIEMSQRFTRRITGDDSSASLRDVKRCVKLYDWFLTQYCSRNEIKIVSIDSLILDPSLKFIVGRSAVLSIAHCYYYRLSQDNRIVFEEHFKSHISKYSSLHINSDFSTIVIEEQNYYSNMMEIPNGICLNNALRENIFSTLVSIMNYIPCFIIGKSGSSKSLAMEILKQNLCLKGSLKRNRSVPLPGIELFVYSCSKFSTPEGLIQTFNAARRFKSSNLESDSITVVLLNEVGLLEQSPHFPLKVLYRELNDLDSGIAIIGLSNFQFDPSVSNRTIVVNRTPPDEKDLSLVVRGIVDSRHLDNNLSLLAKGYQTVYKSQKQWNIREDFFGLRDLYALIKYINTRLKDQFGANLLSSAVYRNFGGVPRCLPEILKIFFAAVGFGLEEIESSPAMPVLDRIRDNIQDTGSRNLMLISENNASLHHLFDQKILNLKDTDIIFGNGYLESTQNDDTHIVMTIQKIKVCMSEGRTAVLVGCEDLYNSLYDLFNMQYTEVYGKRFVSLALGTYSKLCLVHQNFKAIVIVEKKQVDSSLAIALLNRFEKQSFDDSDLIVSEKAKTLSSKLEYWITHFKKGCEVHLETKSSIKTQAFAGFHPNLVNSLVVHLMLKHGEEDISTLFKRGVNKLLNIATADAIVRSKKRFGQTYFDTYFKEQNHISIQNLLNYLDSKYYHTVNVLTYSPASIDISFVLSQAHRLEYIHYDYLHKMESESEVLDCLKHFFDFNNPIKKLIFQCDLSVVTQQKIQQVKLIGDRLRQEDPIRSKKMIIFLIHIHPFQPNRYQIHFSGSEKNIFLDEIQSISPDFSTLLSEPLTSYLEQIDIRSIISSSFRTSLSQLGYSVPEMNIPRKINIFSFLLLQDTFWSLLQPKMKLLISNYFAKKNPTYWSEFVAMKVVTFFESGNYCQSLVNHVSQMLIFSFSYILAQTDIDWNMEILYNYLKNYSNNPKTSELAIGIWSEGFRNITFPPHHTLSLSNLDFSLWPDNLMKVHSYGIESKFPFSFIYCKTLHELRSVCEHSRTSLSEVLKTYIRFALPHLADLPQELSIAYLHDYLCRYGFETIHVSKSIQLQIVTYLLKAYKPGFSGIADVQEFIWEQEPRLHTYFSALECIPGAAHHYLKQLSKPLFLFSIQQCDIFLLETLFEAIYPPQRIAVSEIYQFSEDEWVERISAVTTPILQLLSLIQDISIRKSFEIRFKRFQLHKLYLKEIKRDGYSFWSMIKNEDPRSSGFAIKLIQWGLEKIFYLNNENNLSILRFLEFYCHDVVVDEFLFSCLSDQYLGEQLTVKFPSESLMITIIRSLILQKKENFLLRDNKHNFPKLSSQPSMKELYIEAYRTIYSTLDYRSLYNDIEWDYPNFIQKIKENSTVLDFTKASGILRVYISQAENLLYQYSISESSFHNEISLEERKFLEISCRLAKDLGSDFMKKLLFQECLHKRGYSSLLEIVTSNYAKQLAWPYTNDLDSLKDQFSPYRLLLENASIQNKEARLFLDCIFKKKSSEVQIKQRIKDILQAYESLSFYFKSKSVRKDNIISFIANICALGLGNCSSDPFFDVLLWEHERISSSFIPGQEGFEEKIKIEGNYCHGISTSDNSPLLKDAFYRVRNLSPVTTRVIHLWIHSLLMIGKIIRKSHVKDINYEAKLIFNHWDALIQILSGDEDKACLLLFTICDSFIPIERQFQGKKPFASHTLCEHWENHMEKHIRKDSIQSIISSNNIPKFEDFHKFKELKFFVDKIAITEISGLRQTTFTKFKCNLLNEIDEKKHKALRYFALSYSQLELTKYIPSIQKWIDILDKTLNRKIEKNFTKEHTIEEFIESFEQSEQNNLKSLFIDFKTAYNSLFVRDISEKSPIYDCIRNQKRLIDDLVSKHNKMIQNTSKKNYSISISSRFASKFHLIIFDWENDIYPALNLYSNLDMVEEYFCDKYVDGKPLIQAHVPEFVYLENSSEIKFRSQLGINLAKVIPQAPLHKDVFNQVMESFEDPESKLNLHSVLQEIEQMILIIEAIARSTSSLPHAADTKIGHIAKNFLLLDENSSLLKYPKICEISLHNLINLFDSLHVIKNS